MVRAGCGFNQSSLVIEAAVGGRGVGVWPSAPWPRRDLDATAGWFRHSRFRPPVDFAYYAVYPKAKGRLPQVKAFVAWILEQARAHEAALRTIDNGAGI